MEEEQQIDKKVGDGLKNLTIYVLGDEDYFAIYCFVLK
jgi:hypothetical protein